MLPRNYWIHQNTIMYDMHSFPKGALGFVYILEAPNGIKYIGRKLLWNKKNRKKVESNWQDYFGSSKDFLKIVQEFGKDRIARKILWICFTLSEIIYLESYEIFHRHALIDPMYANKWVMCRVRAENLGKKKADILM